MSEPIVQTLLPVTHDLGAFQVRRVLPSPARTMVGPFIFVDQFGPAVLPVGTAMDVRPHPHITVPHINVQLRNSNSNHFTPGIPEAAPGD